MSEDTKAKAKTKLKHVLLSDVHESPVALRTVDREGERYQGVRDSIADGGLLNPVLLRPVLNEEGKEILEVVEGLHRVTAHRELGLETIAAQIMDMDDARVMEAQIIGNFQRVDTKPTEFSEQLKKIISLNSNLTEAQLANKLHVSTAWLQQRLSLNKIKNPDVQNLINSGKIKLANAYALAKLPEDEITGTMIESAMVDSSDEFIRKVLDRVKEIRDAKRAGRSPDAKPFEPVAHFHKLSEVRDQATGKMDEVLPLLKDCKDTLEAARIALLWVLHLDAVSVAAQKATYDAKEAERQERAEKRQAEIVKRKQEKAELAKKLADNAQARMDGSALPYPELEEGEETAPVKASE